jgi:hypothetical protein
MQVKTGDRIYLDARTKAEPAESVVTIHYYTQLPQIRLTSDSTGRPTEPETSTAVTLDGNDIAELVMRDQASCPEYAICGVGGNLESRRIVSADFPVRS